MVYALAYGLSDVHDGFSITATCCVKPMLVYLFELYGFSGDGLIVESMWRWHGFSL